MSGIAVIGWGSLIWSPRGLNKATGWAPGPELPVEFARISNDGRVTLVLYGEHLIPTFSTVSGYEDLAQACENLRRREGNARPGDIHYTTGNGLQTHGGEPPSEAAKDVAKEVDQWLASRPDLDAAVWTGLPPRGFAAQDRPALAAEVVGYLSGLSGRIEERSRQYVRRAPAPVRTPVRAAIEAHPLRWLPEDLSPSLFEG